MVIIEKYFVCWGRLELGFSSVDSLVRGYIFFIVCVFLILEDGWLLSGFGWKYGNNDDCVVIY